MTPTELLESVKARFNPLLVREEETLKAFLIKALTTYQDRAGVVKTLKLEKAGGTAIPLPEDYLSLVHVTDNNGLLVYSDELSGFIELELTGSERWPFRMLYLVNLRDRKLDEWQVPPAIIGMLEEYLEAARKRMRLHSCDVCIHGHHHLSGIWDVPEGKVIATGQWLFSLGYVRMRDGGFEIIDETPQKSS